MKWANSDVASLHLVIKVLDVIEYLPRCKYWQARWSANRTLDCLGAREQAAVNSVDDGLGSDLFTAKESSVQALDGVFSALDSVKLEIDIALRVGI